MKVYVAGPMRGVPQFGYPMFKKAAEFLRSLSWVDEVFNPAERDEAVGFDFSQAKTGSEEDMRRQNFSLREALSADLAWITTYADGVVLLPGWKNSLGAIAEHNTAVALGLEIFSIEEGSSGVLYIKPVASMVASKEEKAEPAPATGEVRTTSSKGGQKGVKLARYDLIPASPLRLLAEHYGRGAGKYSNRQWEKGYEWSKSFAALQRHAWQFWAGEDYDIEDGPLEGSPHLAAVAWHAFAMMEFMDTNRDLDDRPVQIGVDDDTSA